MRAIISGKRNWRENVETELETFLACALLSHGNKFISEVRHLLTFFAKYVVNIFSNPEIVVFKKWQDEANIIYDTH